MVAYPMDSKPIRNVLNFSTDGNSPVMVMVQCSRLYITEITYPHNTIL